MRLPSTLEERFRRRRLDRFDAPDRFHEERVGLSPPLSALFHGTTQEGRHHEREHRIGGQRGDYHAREGDAIEEHDGKEDSGEQRVDDGAQGRAGQEVANALQFSNSGHRVPDPARLEVGKRKPESMPDYPHPEVDIDSARRMRKEVGAQAAKHALERDEEEHAGGDDIEGNEAPVHEDLVDHHLGGEWSEEGEELEKQ